MTYTIVTTCIIPALGACWSLRGGANALVKLTLLGVGFLGLACHVL